MDAAYALGGGKKTWKNDPDQVTFVFGLSPQPSSVADNLQVALS